MYIKEDKFQFSDLYFPGKLSNSWVLQSVIQWVKEVAGGSWEESCWFLTRWRNAALYIYRRPTPCCKSFTMLNHPLWPNLSIYILSLYGSGTWDINSHKCEKLLIDNHILDYMIPEQKVDTGSEKNGKFMASYPQLMSWDRVTEGHVDINNSDNTNHKKCNNKTQG